MRSLKINGATGLLLCWYWGVSVAWAEESRQLPKNFTALFNGNNLENWVETLPPADRGGASITPSDVPGTDGRQRNEALLDWRVKQGVIVGQSEGAVLSTASSYENFELMVDWRSSPREQGGISVRGVTFAPFKKFTKSGENRAAASPRDGWNRLWMRVVGPLVSVRLNGVETAVNQPFFRDFNPTERMPLRGPVGLVAGKRETHFRNVFIRELSFDESARILATVGEQEDGFVSLFNGHDLTGWIGATKSYVVKDDAIECLPEGLGQLLTTERFDDFIVRLEFKLPPGGNSGLAIRTEPTDTDPAFQSFEIQVLDDTAEKYAALQKYQYHGSLYGLQPAKRGYLRSIGQWNYQETTVRDDRFRVNLNGFEILDVALRDLPKEPMDHQPHPGVIRREGHFGFCSHYDPVAFRNIRIKRLPTE